MSDSKPTIIICSLCGVGVPEDKITIPDRCNDKSCPLNKLAAKRARPIEHEPTVLNAG